ncbi:hypothetical protein NB231_11394 [Nitrococcus mobilis Nb-231]|uniref:Uncharacterized protein n=1 Tax=Nitrococcus mobilis Nb-231 TaxID=314278 RepID=A4BP36_9GAMM|nr:hypothetical protein NB231_11394 [Nitrococcus mobilis Nb-231]
MSTLSSAKTDNMIDEICHYGHAMETADYELKVVAMAKNFYGPGLSTNSGYGYQR